MLGVAGVECSYSRSGRILWKCKVSTSTGLLLGCTIIEAIPPYQHRLDYLVSTLSTHLSSRHIAGEAGSTSVAPTACTCISA